MFKIEILNNYNNDLFNQLKQLIEKFAIYVFVVQKFNLANESYKKKSNYICNYKKFLSTEDLKYLEKDINERIDFAINSLNSFDNEKKTRYYLLLNENRVIAFQTAQVRKEKDRIEGWRNFAYIDDSYRGRINEVIDSYGKRKRGILSNILYENISDWFAEEKVEVEKTATGKNMYKNIKTYIKKGFIPEKCDDKKIYLIKHYSQSKKRKN